MDSNPKFIVIESVDDTGKPVRKFVPADQSQERTFYAVYGDYIRVDMDREQYAKCDAIRQAKDELLEQLIGCIRELAKNDDFWIVKEVDEHTKTVGWKVYFPQMDK